MSSPARSWARIASSVASSWACGEVLRVDPPQLARAHPWREPARQPLPVDQPVGLGIAAHQRGGEEGKESHRPTLLTAVPPGSAAGQPLADQRPEQLRLLVREGVSGGVEDGERRRRVLGQQVAGRGVPDRGVEAAGDEQRSARRTAYRSPARRSASSARRCGASPPGRQERRRVRRSGRTGRACPGCGRRSRTGRSRRRARRHRSAWGRARLASPSAAGTPAPGPARGRGVARRSPGRSGRRRSARRGG